MVCKNAVQSHATPKVEAVDSTGMHRQWVGVMAIVAAIDADKDKTITVNELNTYVLSEGVTPPSVRGKSLHETGVALPKHSLGSLGTTATRTKSRHANRARKVTRISPRFASPAVREGA